MKDKLDKAQLGVSDVDYGLGPASRIISEGVWGIYVVQGGRRLLDGEATDERDAWQLFAAAIRVASPSTRVELVNPSGQTVDASKGVAG